MFELKEWVFGMVLVIAMVSLSGCPGATGRSVMIIPGDENITIRDVNGLDWNSVDNALPWQDENVANNLTIQTSKDLNVSAGAGQGVSIASTASRICFPSNTCEAELDWNGDALVFRVKP